MYLKFNYNENKKAYIKQYKLAELRFKIILQIQLSRVFLGCYSLKTLGRVKVIEGQMSLLCT